jgi:phosphomannomutase
MSLTCFKAYDIRGRLGIDLDEAIATRIGRALAQALPATRVVIGHDCRASSVGLTEAVISGLLVEGVQVLELGLCGTEEMYHATTHFDADGGLMITASHNPIDYNGMKIVRKGSAPLDSATGLGAIKALAEANSFGTTIPGGTRRNVAGQARAAYTGTVLSFVDVGALKPLKILVNAGNGAAGPTFDAIAVGLQDLGAPLSFTRVHHDPDPSFPHGIPNPLLIENRRETARAVVAAQADMGVAWDGDFDRCFFFDATGRFIGGEYIVGLLAEVFLAKEPGANIVHDSRVIWNTRDLVAKSGGVAIQSRTGHAFVKQAMRNTGAIYGGEMSAHHYFRDFVYCDSGMIPWLLIAELICRSGQSLAELVKDRKSDFPSSGEINFHLTNPAAAIARVRAAYEPQATASDESDGISLEIGDWRFNLRASNTEPAVRLNVESRGQAALLAPRIAAIQALLMQDR